MGRKKMGYDAPEGLVKLKPSPFWWIALTYNGKTIRESTKTKDLDEAIKMLEDVKRSPHNLHSVFLDIPLSSFYI